MQHFLGKLTKIRWLNFSCRLFTFDHEWISLLWDTKTECVETLLHECWNNVAFQYSVLMGAVLVFVFFYVWFELSIPYHIVAGRYSTNGATICCEYVWMLMCAGTKCVLAIMDTLDHTLSSRFFCSLECLMTCAVVTIVLDRNHYFWYNLIFASMEWTVGFGDWPSVELTDAAALELGSVTNWAIPVLLCLYPVPMDQMDGH